ncbi:MAG: hypothetical protein E7612_07965 [Ruminococcaceae bacterium]|nr:hypothetical protein [Oscillospiraceae bacterium]
MRFLKENSYDIVRLYINQIGITIFSLVLYFSITSLSDNPDNPGMYLKVKIGISILATVFFYALLYTAAWDWGANDKIRIDAGKINKRIGKGALIAATANSLNFVLAGGCVISELVYANGEGIVSQIFRPFLLLTNAMYIGVVQGICSNMTNTILAESVAYLIFPLLAITVVSVGYIFGMKYIKIFPSSNKKNKSYK